MHNGALRKWALALTFWLVLHTTALKAQILGPYGTSPTTFEVDANGLISDTGTFGTGTLSLSGTGTRMFWYPGKAAFRAGYVSSTQWNDANIGQYSVAFGSDSIASGQDSAAFGNSTASGSNSVAMGTSVASNMNSVAIGSGSTASGEWSVAIGNDSTASGTGSTAFGSGLALGPYSTAMEDSTASGYCSTAFGQSTTASGRYSTASGYGTTASAQLSFVIGVCNIGLNSTGGTPSATTWVSTDPLFEIGNGGNGYYGNPALTTSSDALVVYKNGNAVLQGSLQVAPGGDIPMYTGN